MEEKDIKTIGIQNFKDNPMNMDVIDYADEDVVVINSLNISSFDDEMVRLGCLFIVTCIEGSIQLDINAQTCQVHEGCVLVGIPNSIIGRRMLTPHNKIKLVVFSNAFLHRTFRYENDTWNTALYIHKNPVKSIKADDNTYNNWAECGIKLFWNLLMQQIKGESHYFRKEVVQHLLAAYLYKLMGVFNGDMSKESDKLFHEYSGSSSILRKFLKLLGKDNGMHRSVSYFANELCYTPKHFSKTVKQACGKTPLQIINETAIEHIKYRLKHSEKSIKEIAEEFNFPNQSFFGKYVKAHIGMTPASYRKAANEE